MQQYINLSIINDVLHNAKDLVELYKIKNGRINFGFVADKADKFPLMSESNSTIKYRSRFTCTVVKNLGGIKFRNALSDATFDVFIFGFNNTKDGCFNTKR